MKKFLILLSLVIPALGFMSCSDDNDLPDVNIEVNFDNVVNSDGTLYVVQGQDFSVSSITVTNNEAGKPAGLTGANYYWDYMYVGTSLEEPFTYEFTVAPTVPVGRHVLQIEGNLIAVDKSLAFAVISTEIQVVASADDIPAATAPATVSMKAAVKETSSK